MPLPLFFIGAALATGAIGGEKTIQAAMDNSKAKKINMIANDNVESARTELERQRQETGLSLDQLGKIKLDVLDHDVLDFVTTFEKIKNIDFQSSIGLDELKDLHIDQNTFTELKELGNFALEVAGGASAGAVGGALTAIGAYGAATTFASASTGTAISTLSGIAAQNATLAFFGGGSLASGGLGMAGGMMVLGGLVAGPALMVMGLITSAKTQEKLENALANKAQADEIVESLNAASYQCSAIRLLQFAAEVICSTIYWLIWILIFCRRSGRCRTLSPQKELIIEHTHLSQKSVLLQLHLQHARSKRYLIHRFSQRKEN